MKKSNTAFNEGVAQHSHLVIKEWFERLGNNIVQITHAIDLAKQTKSKVSIPHHHGLLETHDIDFSEGAECTHVVENRFFHRQEGVFKGRQLTWETRQSIVREFIKPMLPARLFTHNVSDGLVIHVRAGDIFERDSAMSIFRNAPSFKTGIRRLRADSHRVNRFFAQPPLAYYNRIIGLKPWSSITLVAEDRRNPVIDVLLKSNPQIQFVPSDIESDIRTLLSAKHLVIGYGTFTVPWMLMSDNVQELFSPFIPAKVFGELRPGDIGGVDVHTFQFQDYIELGNWTASRDQKRLMLSYKDENIRTIRRGDQDLSPQF